MPNQYIAGLWTLSCDSEKESEGFPKRKPRNNEERKRRSLWPKASDEKENDAQKRETQRNRGTSLFEDHMTEHSRNRKKRESRASEERKSNRTEQCLIADTSPASAISN